MVCYSSFHCGRDAQYMENTRKIVMSGWLDEGIAGAEHDHRRQARPWSEPPVYARQAIRD